MIILIIIDYDNIVWSICWCYDVNKLILIDCDGVIRMWSCYDVKMMNFDVFMLGWTIWMYDMKRREMNGLWYVIAEIHICGWVNFLALKFQGEGWKNVEIL